MKNRFVPKGTVFRDGEEKIRLEARNGVIQANFFFDTFSSWNTNKKVEAQLILELQRLAVNQIYRCAGFFRDDRVELQGADHVPPPASEVASFVDGMCDYINDHWQQRSPIHLASYAMWRINWIHPFFGGNGRTARAFSYLTLSLSLGFAPPAGSKNIPEYIVDNRRPYYSALRDADQKWANGSLDLQEMEILLSSLLAEQLLDVHKRAIGDSGTRAAN